MLLPTILQPHVQREEDQEAEATEEEEDMEAMEADVEAMEEEAMEEEEEEGTVADQVVEYISSILERNYNHFSNRMKLCSRSVIVEQYESNHLKAP